MYSCSFAGNFEHQHDYSSETRKVWVISLGTSSLTQYHHASKKQSLPLVDLLVLPLASTSLHGDVCNGDPALDRSSSISCTGAWALTCHFAQRKREMNLQSEAPVAPDQQHRAQRQSNYFSGKHASTSADLDRQRLRDVVAMCKALTSVDAEPRQCIIRLHIVKACLRSTGLSMLTESDDLQREHLVSQMQQ